LTTKKIFAFDDIAVIQIVRQLLAEHGIRSTVLNELTGNVVGAIPFYSAVPEVWVADEDESRGTEIVESYESGEVREEIPKQCWTCPGCGEIIEGQFNNCWKCGDRKAENK